MLLDSSGRAARSARSCRCRKEILGDAWRRSRFRLVGLVLRLRDVAVELRIPSLIVGRPTELRVGVRISNGLLRFAVGVASSIFVRLRLWCREDNEEEEAVGCAESKACRVPWNGTKSSHCETHSAESDEPAIFK